MTDCRRPKCSRAGKHGDLCYVHYSELKRRGLVGKVDTAPVVAHVRKLYDLGWDDLLIADHAGIDQRVVRAAREHSSCRAASALAIFSVPLVERGSVRRLAPALPTIRRIQGMNALGYGQPEIAELASLTKSAVCKVLNGYRTPSYATALRIREAADKVGDTPGPSPTVAARAKSKGYLPLAAWDDIDDLNEQPDIAKTDGRKAKAKAPIEELVFFASYGWSCEKLAAKFGVSENYVRERLKEVA